MQEGGCGNRGEEGESAGGRVERERGERVKEGGWRERERERERERRRAQEGGWREKEERE